MVQSPINRSCACLLTALFCALIAPADAAAAPAVSPGGLPLDVVPLAYRVHVTPDLKHATTRGDETIALDVRNATRSVEFNARKVDVRSATLDGAAAAEVTFDPQREVVRATWSRPIAPGRHALALRFSARIQDNTGIGFFTTTFPLGHGTSTMVSTQFESADARRFFPCWDEPFFRSTFTLSVDVPRAWSAYSNMPRTARTPAANGLDRVSFAPTPKMPTYLLAFVAGDLQRVHASADGIDVGVIAPRGRLGETAFALRSAVELLHYYDDYFAYRFPLPKLDLIAIPGGFDGAMENWGAITFQEEILLYDPARDAAGAQRDIFITIAHEMAHQWFGDLVTMRWWDVLWLNEGFATWMETKATDHFHPEWLAGEDAVADARGTMVRDARAATHPIVVPVPDAAAADTIFDAITYVKAGAVLRMFEGYLGDDAFRDGLRRYIRADAYGNATSADLWRALGAASGRDVATLANPWVRQPGVPEVSLHDSCAGGSRAVALAQERLTIDAPSARAEQWPIPLALATLGSPPQYTLFSAPATATLAGCAGTLLANGAGRAYAAVGYDDATLAALRANFAAVAPLDQIVILGDRWLLAQAGRAPLATYFAFVAAIPAVADAPVWSQAFGSIARVRDLLRGRPSAADFNAYVRRTLAPLFATLGWNAVPGESDRAAGLRADTIGALAAADDPDAIAEARRRFAAFVDHGTPLDPALRATILRIAGRNADAATYDELRKLAESAPNYEARAEYVSSFAAARDPKLAARTLPLALSGPLPVADDAYLLVRVANALDDPQPAWDYLRAHQRALFARLDPATRAFLVGALVARNPAWLDQVLAMERTWTPAMRTAIADSLATARFERAFTATQIPPFEAWLAAPATSPSP